MHANKRIEFMTLKKLQQRTESLPSERKHACSIVTKSFTALFKASFSSSRSYSMKKREKIQCIRISTVAFSGYTATTTSSSPCPSSLTQRFHEKKLKDSPEWCQILHLQENQFEYMYYEHLQEDFVATSETHL